MNVAMHAEWILPPEMKFFAHFTKLFPTLRLVRFTVRQIFSSLLAVSDLVKKTSENRSDPVKLPQTFELDGQG